MAKRVEAMLQYQGPYLMESPGRQPMEGYVVTLVHSPDAVFLETYSTARYARVDADRHAIRMDTGKEFTGETFEAVHEQLVAWLQFLFGVTVTRVVEVAPDPKVQLRPYPLES